MKKSILILIVLTSAMSLYSQTLEDGLRLTRKENGASARSNALGLSYQGINDDGAALYFNPAGLFLIPTSEIQMGVNVKYIKSYIDYLGNDFTNDRSNQNLSNFTFVAPLGDDENRMTFAIGYFRDFNYDDQLNFSAFNQNGSFIRNQSDNGNYLVSDLGLAPYDSPGLSPITNSLKQNYSLKLEGANSKFSMGLALSLGKKAALGFSYSLHTADYSNYRKLDEIDVHNKYNFNDSENFTDVDFNYLNSDVKFSQNITGHTGTVGFMLTPTENSRAFISVDLPTFYMFEDTYKEEYYVNFDNNENSSLTNNGKISYNVATPFRFNFGASYNIIGITVSGAMSYMDMTNLKFSEPRNSQVVTGDRDFFDNINQTIDERLASAKIDWGIGAEYKFPLYPVFLRASYSSKNTPYREGFRDLSTIKTLAVGAGFLVSDKIMLDASLSNSKFDETYFAYSNQAYFIDRNNTNVFIGFSYRFN